MRIEVAREETEKVIVLRVVGAISSANVGDLEAPLLEAASTPARRVALDLSGVTYMSSAGLRALIVAAKQLHARGERLELRKAQPAVAAVLRVSNFATFLDITA